MLVGFHAVEGGRELTLSGYLLSWGDGEGRSGAIAVPPIYPCHGLALEEGCHRSSGEMAPAQSIDHDIKMNERRWGSGLLPIMIVWLGSKIKRLSVCSLVDRQSWWLCNRTPNAAVA